MYVLICLVLIAIALALIFVPQFKGYKTIIFNGLLAAFGAITPMLADTFGFMQGLDWTKYVSENAVPWMVLGIGVGGIILRYATKGPVGQK